ncbi:MAG TPA: class I SAM-dependent methyltransferase, partial [Phnomibacter sp.]|nr:class I SAM-dependent methyltransferase [Phnomibacter sp.]
MHTIYLRKKISPRIENGHPWIFANEVDETRSAGSVAPGDIVEVQNARGQFVGRGYINPKSQILVRLLTRLPAEVVDEAFFYRRLLKAWEYRQHIGYTQNCRLIFGEADEMPALIIDKFGDYFVLQTLALGMDVWKPAIVKALQQIFNPQGIYEPNDVPVRELEGLPQVKGLLSAPFDTSIIIEENGLRFHVDIENGQKTGYFLDQQDNRRAIRHIVKGASVLEA